VNADAPALVVRARALRRRLPRLEELSGLAALETPAALGAALAERRIPPAGPPGRDEAEALESGFRALVAALLTVLERWRGRGRDALAIALAEEERRSLRALLRGAAAGAAPELRLAGLVPTPALTPRRLEELARAADPRALASKLAIFRFPDAGAFAAAAAVVRPDLAAMERTLRARFGVRLREIARRGERELAREAEFTIDLDNAVAAAALAGGDEPVREDDFLEGGRKLSRGRFARAAASASSGAAVALLSGAFADREIGRAFQASVVSPARLGERLVAARLARATAEARLRPLGSAPVLELALSMRALGMAISRLVWGLALAAPADARRGAAA
jgi:hypothetical protein